MWFGIGVDPREVTLVSFYCESFYWLERCLSRIFNASNVIIIVGIVQIVSLWILKELLHCQFDLSF
jgi:hypothetical protein